MNHSVKTTHVIPRHLPPVRIGNVTTLLVCRNCLATVGAYRTSAERLRLETKHICTEKLSLGKPAVSVPFN